VHAADDVVAFGASAISDVSGLYAQNAHVIGRYEQLAKRGRDPTERGFRLSADDLRRRDLIQKLMCNFWIDLGPRAFTEFGPELEKLRALEKDGLLTLRGSEVELTRLGRIFVRNIGQRVRRLPGRATSSGSPAQSRGPGRPEFPTEAA